jgi:hypothetical protein
MQRLTPGEKDDMSLGDRSSDSSLADIGLNPPLLLTAQTNATNAPPLTDPFCQWI